MGEFWKAWRNITLEGAKHVRDHAVLKASELGISVSVVVVDRSGVILLAETADLAPPGAFEASIIRRRALTTRRDPQKPFCCPFLPAANAHSNSEVTFPFFPSCSRAKKNSSSHLHLTGKGCIS
jgi:hypothetical protein